MPLAGVGPPPVIVHRDKEQLVLAPRAVTEHSDGRQPGVALPMAPVLLQRVRSPPSRSLPTGMLFSSWDDVPVVPSPDLKQGSVFVEIFSGKAGFTKALRKRGWLVLPPIDVVVDGDVLFPADILDPSLLSKLMSWLRSGVIRLVHFGTPCTTFSRARRDDGGPPPIRSPEYLNGIPGIPADDQARVDMGTEFLDITVRLAALASEFDAAWTIENPLSSMMWLMPQTIELQACLAAARVELHMCAYGALSMKPTMILCSGKHFLHLDKRCPGKSLSINTSN